MNHLTRAALLLALGLPLTGCTDKSSSPTAESTRSPAPSEASESSSAPSHQSEPTGYRYLLRSYCGYRLLYGTFAVLERDDVVLRVKTIGEGSGYTPKPKDIPTLSELLAKAENAPARAKVHLEVDANGLPVVVRIDYDPNEQDDEECYDVSDLVPTY